MKKPKVVIKKPTYKGFSIVTSLEKIFTRFYSVTRPRKYVFNTRLCFNDVDSFKAYKKCKNNSEDIAKDVH